MTRIGQQIQSHSSQELSAVGEVKRWDVELDQFGKDSR